MPFVLRKISRSKWYKQGHPWLKSGELQADALTDLRTKDNSLSVWQIFDDKSNLDRVVTALATTVNRIANLDFALFNIEILGSLGIAANPTPGKSPDPVVNGWHLDLAELSANKVLVLAHAVSEHGVTNRVLEKRVLELITKSVIAGNIERKGLPFVPEDLARIEQLRTTMKSSLL